MFTRLTLVRPRTYLDETLPTGEPIKLPPHYPPPDYDEFVFRVEITDDSGSRTLVLPCYVPAEVLADYEKFVTLILQVLGVAFSFPDYNRSPDTHSASAAWRGHVAELLDRFVESRAPESGPPLPPEFAGTRIIAWRIGWSFHCIGCATDEVRAGGIPVFEGELKALDRTECDDCKRDLHDILAEKGTTADERTDSRDAPPE